jgi:hypothetical protein
MSVATLIRRARLHLCKALILLKIDTTDDYTVSVGAANQGRIPLPAPKYRLLLVDGIGSISPVFCRRRCSAASQTRPLGIARRPA